jgi:hypothetical protein
MFLGVSNLAVCSKNIIQVSDLFLYTNRPCFSPARYSVRRCYNLMGMVGWFIPVAPTLEHRTCVKRFVSLQFLNLRHSVGLLRRVISPSQGRYLTQTQNKHKQTFMPRVGFEPTIPAFERAKTVHALDCTATVIDNSYDKSQIMNWKGYGRKGLWLTRGTIPQFVLNE